jgi:hypothetical protein
MSSAKFEAATFAGVAVARPAAAAGWVLPVFGCAPKQYICAPCDTKIFWFFTWLQKNGFGRPVCASAGLLAPTTAGNARTVATTNMRRAHDVPSRSLPARGKRDNKVRMVPPRSLRRSPAEKHTQDQTEQCERPARTAPLRARSARRSLLLPSPHVKHHLRVGFRRARIR